MFTLLLSGCIDKQNSYPLYFSNSKGWLLLKGQLISGSQCTYWTINLRNNRISELGNQKWMDILELNYIQNLNNNPSEEKVSHHFELMRMNTGLAVLKSMLEGGKAPDKTIKFSSFLSGNQDFINAQNGRFIAISNHETNRMVIIDKVKGTKIVLKFRNKFFAQTLSPDERYIALLEHQDNVFNDGDNYRIRIININTGKIYSIKNDLVSLPGGLLWVDTNT